MNVGRGLQDLAAGARAVGTGLGMVLQPGLRRFVVVPLALNTALFGGLILALVWWMDPWVDHLSARFGGFLGALAWVLFAVLLLLLVWQTFVVVGTWVGSPFYGFLAAAVEHRLQGQAEPGTLGWRELLAEAGFALAQEWRKACYFLRLILPVLALALVPVVQLAAPALWLLVSAWILAVESADFPLSNRRMPLPRQRDLLRRRPGLAWGLGLATLALGLVPVIQLLAIPASVAGATCLWVEHWRPLTGARPGTVGIGPGRASEPGPPSA